MSGLSTKAAASPTGKTLAEVEAMTHEDLCRYWRFAKAGSLQRGDVVSDRLTERLFREYGGFTPAISKKIGW